MTKNRLIIGVDYGTTYTGVSFCESSQANLQEHHIEVIHDWPSCHTKIGTKEKVPSEIAYRDEGLVWGSLIRPNVPRQMWTKLQLDVLPKGESDKIYRETQSSDMGSSKPPVDIVADFLAQVKLHLIKNLDQKFGAKLWRTLPITLIVTVPAVWSDAAKDRTLQAFEKAGFNPCEFPLLKAPILTTEPEAAAIHTIKTMRGSTQDKALAVGDGFTVCDMGGGTVDLISYTVAGVNPTTISEATVGNGDQCGGTFVDRKFLEWLERRLGTTDFIELAGCRSENVPFTSLAKKAAQMLQDFTLEAKTCFSGSEPYSLRLPKPLSQIDDDESRGIYDGELDINAEDIQKMFEPCLLRTYELLAEQRQRARLNKVKIKYVFLVGGFSESPYVFNKLKTYLEMDGLEIVKPSYAWSAVVRGAVTKGLENSSGAVVKRKSRRHYGTGCSQPFKRNIHRNCKTFVDPYNGVKYANHRSNWLIAKAQDLHTNKTHAKTEFSSSFWPGESRRTTWELLACDADEPPKSSQHQSVYTVATLTVDMDDIPDEYFERKRSPKGKLYYSIMSTINISMGSALEFFLTVGGQKYGSLTAAYE